VTRSRTPSQAGYHATLGQGNILQMLSHGPSVPQIVILLDETAIELLQRSPSDLKKFNGSEIR
jgi:hypothetical protein